MAIPSQIDDDLGPLDREHITRFIQRIGRNLSAQSGRLLEIGPQERSIVRESFANHINETFDIVDTYNPTHVGDITNHNVFIPNETYDCIVCMEVLEHTLDPFAAVRELRRMLKHGGHLLVSAPLNWRIHGPIPDCWRFTEHGFKVLPGISTSLRSISWKRQAGHCSQSTTMCWRKPTNRNGPVTVI
jgi:SAM-dependent methyltransferase